MKNLISLIFVVLLLFLFMAQPAITGPPPPDWIRISPDPLDDDPWDELAYNQNDKTYIGEWPNIMNFDANSTVLEEKRGSIISFGIIVITKYTVIYNWHFKSLDDGKK